MRRANIGCGTIQPEGWTNIDSVDYGQEFVWDATCTDWLPKGPRRNIGHLAIPMMERLPTRPFREDPFDYAVANHLLSCFSHHDLKEKVLPNLMSMMKPNGVLRVLVPDADLAIRAYCNNDVAWFPLGPDLPDINERLCTFLPWFGESKSIFTWSYLASLANSLGYGVVRCEFGKPGWPHVDPEIASLDDREQQSLIVEIKAHHDR